jgi:hypothetical protein
MFEFKFVEVTCGRCNGTGGEDACCDHGPGYGGTVGFAPCPECDGSGVLYEYRRTLPNSDVPAHDDGVFAHTFRPWLGVECIDERILHLHPRGEPPCPKTAARSATPTLPARRIVAAC